MIELRFRKMPPLQFLYTFRDLMRDEGIRFAITFAGIDRQSLINTATSNAAKAGLTTIDNVKRVIPPTTVLLP